MAMLGKLKTLFSKRENEGADGMDQKQREAMIDLLLLCIYSDNELTLNEERIFDREIERFNWKSESSIDEYVANAKPKVLAILESQESRLQHLQKINRDLKNGEARYRALKLCNHLFYSDFDLGDEEKIFMKEIETTFAVK